MSPHKVTFAPVQPQGFHFYQDGQKWLLKGVTYGPFAPGDTGDSYPETQRLETDFKQIADAGANTIRLYDSPSDRVPAAAARFGLRLIIDIPWPKHLDVYDDAVMCKSCLDLVTEGVARANKWENALGVFLGNEIPADLVRWHGARKVEALIHEMYRRAKSIAPHLLIGFANYPSTEYLELDFLDFVGFNIYLNDPWSLREYLVRLRHLYPDKPIIISECGLDSRDAGSGSQADLIPQYICAGFESGLAGILVFAWTDEWFTGGVEIAEWDFGLVDREGRPKPALEPVSQTFKNAPQCMAVSCSITIVIATYNGGLTLRQCLDSIQKLNYPDFETIVVDDGSTDNTQEIVKDFPGIKVISQENLGLSAARNAGIDAATGEIVAFTDSDCVVDKDWLYFVALFLQDNPHLVGVGGPNITPHGGQLIQKAIALAPGHATHVLISHTEAEHVPGCNMAFRRQQLQEVGGFDPIYRKAGDDVDIIWRLQDHGYSIGFSTAAFVWHHRRPTVFGYLKQQRGYGEAETLLLRKHPHRFNDRGQSVWRGIIYPSHSMRSFMGSKRIQYGVFGTAGYQCVYHTATAMWFYYVTSVEFWTLCLLLLVAGLISPAAFAVGLIGLMFSVAVSGSAAYSNWPASADYSKSAFPIVWALWVLHPLVRGGARYWYRLRHLPEIKSKPADSESSVPKSKERIRYYWCEEAGMWRTDILRLVEQEMLLKQWICAPNGIWDNWDISVVLSPWYKTRISTMEECFGGSKRLLRMRYNLVPSSLFYTFTIGSLGVCFLIALYDTILARWVLSGFLVFVLWAYRSAIKGTREVGDLAEQIITRNGYYAVSPPEKLTNDSSTTQSCDVLVGREEKEPEHV